MIISHKHELDYSPYDMEDDDATRPTIQTHKADKGIFLKFLPKETWIVYVIEGQLTFSYGEHTNKIMGKGQMALFLSGYQAVIQTEAESLVIAIRINEQIQLCDCFPTVSLLEDKSTRGRPHSLTIFTGNSVINNYMLTLDTYIKEGLSNENLLEYKVKELFFLLQKYYTKDELFNFFYFYLTNDLGFSNIVKAYSNKAKTVQELADLVNYSLSGFHKRFKRVFGVSAYQWMTEQKSQNILHEIISTTKSLKEISDEYGFSSPSHFNDFCKNHYKKTPGAIRKKRGHITTEA